MAWLLGLRAGAEMFFLPCLVLTVLAFRAAEVLPRTLLTLLPFGLFLALLGAPHAPVIYTAAAYASLFRLNAASVAALSVVLPYLLGAARGEG